MNKYLSKAALALAALGLVSPASASLTQSGVNWHAYNASESTKIDYLVNGVRTTNTSATHVVGSVDWFYNPGGISVYLYGTNTGANTTSLTVYSYNSTGGFLSSQSANLGGTYANHFIGLTAAQAPQFSFVSVLALLPASFNGVFRGVQANY